MLGVMNTSVINLAGLNITYSHVLLIVVILWLAFAGRK